LIDLFLVNNNNAPEHPSNRKLVKDTMTIPGAPERILQEKTNNNEPPQPQLLAVTIPLVNEEQLTAATGGAELSCYRCTVPFGVVVLIAGIVVTAVAYSFNSHGSTISYFGLVLLSAGLVLLVLSAVCWKVRMERKKERRRESQTALMKHLCLIR
uniref:Transmembrane protein 100 n=1 Tax=Sinocyclocheilus rhinocerous TaxID=307959 RepID=A0A673JWT5_9TELE